MQPPETRGGERWAEVTYTGVEEGWAEPLPKALSFPPLLQWKTEPIDVHQMKFPHFTMKRLKDFSCFFQSDRYKQFIQFIIGPSFSQWNCLLRNPWKIRKIRVTNGS